MLPINDFVQKQEQYALPTEPPREKVRLHMNENRFGPSPRCEQVLSGDSICNPLYEYPYKRNAILRPKLADFIGVDEENISINHGSASVIQQILFCALQPGDLVRMPGNSWAYYSMLFNLCGARIEQYDLNFQKDQFSADFNQLCSTETRPKLILINTPHMPTGASLSFDQVKSVLEAHPQALVLLDEAYWGFVEKPTEEEFTQLLKDHSNLVITRTFSKFFALAGERVGYAIASPDLISHLGKWEPLFGISEASQTKALFALEDYDYYSQLRLDYERSKQHFEQALNSEKFVPVRSAGSYFLVQCLQNDPKVVQDLAFSEGFVVRECSHYGLPAFVRISVGKPHEMEQLAAIFAQV